jgi:hypothetical protein
VHSPPQQVAFGALQTTPQAPQLLELMGRQKPPQQRPEQQMPWQMSNPGLQVNPHTPPEHVVVALARGGQTLPQAPQFVVVFRGVSQPSLGLLLQSP